MSDFDPQIFDLLDEAERMEDFQIWSGIETASSILPAIKAEVTMIMGCDFERIEALELASMLGIFGDLTDVGLQMTMRLWYDQACRQQFIAKLLLMESSQNLGILYARNSARLVILTESCLMQKEVGT